MNRPRFNRFLYLVICMSCAVFLVGAVITAMRGEIPFALASQEAGIADTMQEPFLVKDINPSGDSDPQELTNFDDELFFAAADGDYGVGLWHSDGTITGTTFKRDGYIWNEVDVDRVCAFMDKVKQVR